MYVWMYVWMYIYIYIYLYIHIYYLRYENICWNLWVPVKNNYRMYSSSTKLIDIIGLHRRRRPATAAHRRPPTPTAQPTTWLSTSIPGQVQIVNKRCRTKFAEKYRQ